MRKLHNILLTTGIALFFCAWAIWWAPELTCLVVAYWCADRGDRPGHDEGGR